jgi:signal transduction histidine kinase
LSRRYLVALRKHLKQSPPDGLNSARELGRRAVAIGLETLDLARIHNEALAMLEASSSRDGFIERAEIFFAEAITPIEKTHHAAVKGTRRLSELNKTLGRRTADLAATNRSLERGIGRRKAVEEALKKRRAHSERLLRESRQLQENLQRLTRKIMSAQEDKRKKISLDLQDEIGQTLLGINVRLLLLKKEAGLSAARLQKEIARTHRLVDMSVETLDRFAREFGKRNET